MTRRAALCLALSAALLAVPRDTCAAEAADLVLKNAVVHTVDARRPRAEAVAVRGNRIVAVGSTADVQAFVGPRTRVLDLAGRTVVPGFDDSHAHMLGIGFARLDVDLVGTRSYAEVVERVAKAVKTRRPGEWVRGRGWHEGKWDAPAPGAVRGFPTHDALSAVSPDNPVVLERADGHAVLANAKAMASKGITRETKAPAGGEIIRDTTGEATGVFVDNAEGLVDPPERSPDDVRRALDLAMDECLAKGVTSLTDAGAGTDVIALYRERAAAGALRTRLYVMAAGLPTMRALGLPDPGQGMLAVRAVKLYADGALGSRGAALLEPYSDDPGNVGPAGHAARGDPGGRSLRPRPRLPGRHARDRRPCQPDRAGRLRDGLPREPGGEGPALPHRARADPRRRGHPPLREARCPRRHAGDPLPLGSALGPEAPRRRAGGRGGLRVAEAPRQRRPHPQRDGRAGRGRVARPELPRHRHAAGRERPAAGRASTPIRSSPARRHCAR